MQEYRKLLPVTETYAYMDNAAAGPPSRRAIDAVNGFLSQRARLGSLFMDESKAMCERTRQKTARFIGATADEIAFTKNTPDGLNIVANGLTWAAGDNVVLTDVEFPANVYPWMNLRDLGVELKFVRSRNACIDPKDVIAAIDERTRVVALSWVEFHGGFRNDLATIGKACRERGVYLSVDGIQGVGVVRCDVTLMNVDFMAFSAQKWLLAPHAVGILYCRRDLVDRVRVAFAGQTSVILGPNYLDYKLDFKPNAGRFEPGFINQTGIAGFEAALDLFNEIGMERVEARILDLTRQLRNGLRSVGCELLGSEIDAERAGVVSFRHPRRLAAEINAELRRANVIVSEREGFIRVSPHFYNEPAEIDRLLDIVQSAAGAAVSSR